MVNLATTVFALADFRVWALRAAFLLPGLLIMLMAHSLTGTVSGHTGVAVTAYIENVTDTQDGRYYSVSFRLGQRTVHTAIAERLTGEHRGKLSGESLPLLADAATPRQVTVDSPNQFARGRLLALLATLIILGGLLPAVHLRELLPEDAEGSPDKPGH